MKNQNTIAAALLILSCIYATKGQWTPDPFCPFPSDHVTRYPYYGNCSIYWECYQGAKYVMECPQGLEFNAPLQECDAPEIANCDPFASTTDNPNHTTSNSTSPVTNATTSVPTQSTSIGPAPYCDPNSEELIYYPYEGDCTKYWECFAGHSYLYNCPAGLWWHQAISECDYPGNFCNNATTTTTSTTTTEAPTTSGNDPRCSQGGTSYWSQPGDCHKYVECINGLSYIMDCPPSLFFSDRAKECVRIDESECCKIYEC